MMRLAALAAVAFVLGGCFSAGRTPAPTIDLANPCDYICLDTLDTSWGRIAVGTGWDEDAGLLDGYLTAWLVRDGESIRTKLSTLNVADLGVPHLVPWGDRVAIIAWGDVMSAWVTSDGRTWVGPSPFTLRGEFPAHLFFASWGSRLVILGEDVREDRRFASVWTSTDAETWQLAPRPPEWDDASVTGWWEGGDGFVVGIGTMQAESTTEWPWTSADFMHWRPLSAPYPCTWTTEPSVDSQECLPVSGRRPT